MRREPLGRRSLSDIHFDPERTYVGRPGPFGNPFVIGPDGTRAEVIEKYRDLLTTNRRLRELVLAELRGQVLVCHCKLSEACHADVLLEVLDAPHA